jgi:adenylylsulfate kinase
MLLIQMTGLSGAGKTTIAQRAKIQLQDLGFKVEIIDGDEFRKHICKELGFSRPDRTENIRRLAFVGNLLARNGVIVIIAAINPYESVRLEVEAMETGAKTVWIKCPLEEVIRRDVKGYYKRALSPESDKDRITNFTGISDLYEEPSAPDLVIDTSLLVIEEAVERLVSFVTHSVSRSKTDQYEGHRSLTFDQFGN